MGRTYDKDPDAVACLSAEQRRVTQEGGTEPAFTNAYRNNTEPGIHLDVVSLEAEGYGAYRHLFDQAGVTA